MSTYTFKWPKGPQEVIVTGTFDNWSKSLPLVKKADGSFAITTPLANVSEKVLYKYVVDGEWLVSPSQKITHDDAGNSNNFVESEDIEVFSSSIIPETGGLAGVSASQPKASLSESAHATIASEPGIQVPANKEVFSTFEAPRATVVEKKDGVSGSTSGNVAESVKPKAESASVEAASEDSHPEPPSEGKKSPKKPFYQNNYKLMASVVLIAAAHAFVLSPILHFFGGGSS